MREVWGKKKEKQKLPRLSEKGGGRALMFPRVCLEQEVKERPPD